MEFGLFEVIGHSLFWFIIGYFRVISMLPSASMKEVLAGGLLESRDIKDIKRISGEQKNEDVILWVFKKTTQLMLITYFSITSILLFL